MKWHKGTDLPNIETDTALCVVQYKYPVCEDEGFASRMYELYYEVMLFHKDTQSFSKPEDVKALTVYEKIL